jgi:hypothetical protein
MAPMPRRAGHHRLATCVCCLLLWRDSVVRFGHFFQPTEDRRCEVMSFAETTARYRGIGSGGFPATTAADGGVLRADAAGATHTAG